MAERVELVNVDLESPKAITKWARGMCRGQSLHDLAKFYDVEPTARAVSRVIAKDLPEPAKATAIVVCIEALQSSSDGASP